MASRKFITTIEVASKELEWEKQALMAAARQNKLTFATGVYNSDKDSWRYYVDVNTLNKCVKGEKELFRA